MRLSLLLLHLLFKTTTSTNETLVCPPLLSSSAGVCVEICSQEHPCGGKSCKNICILTEPRKPRRYSCDTNNMYSSFTTFSLYVYAYVQQIWKAVLKNQRQFCRCYRHIVYGDQIMFVVFHQDSLRKVLY